MPAKFIQTLVGTTVYVQVDPNINGIATVTLNNATGVGMRFAGESDTLPGVGTTTYTLIPSNSGAVYTFTCNPAKTWFRADTGGGTLSMHLNW